MMITKKSRVLRVIFPESIFIGFHYYKCIVIRVLVITIITYLLTHTNERIKRFRNDINLNTIIRYCVV